MILIRLLHVYIYLYVISNHLGFKSEGLLYNSYCDYFDYCDRCSFNRNMEMLKPVYLRDSDIQIDKKKTYKGL